MMIVAMLISVLVVAGLVGVALSHLRELFEWGAILHLLLCLSIGGYTGFIIGQGFLHLEHTSKVEQSIN